MPTWFPCWEVLCYQHWRCGSNQMTTGWQRPNKCDLLWHLIELTMNCSSLGSVIVVLEETFTGFIPPSQTVIILLFLVRHLTHFQQFQESPRGQSWALHCFCFASVIFQIQLQNKKITMFAEDTELFKEIKSSNDTPALQENPTNLESWFIPFDASLKKSKCHSH